MFKWEQKIGKLLVKLIMKGIGKVSEISRQLKGAKKITIISIYANSFVTIMSLDSLGLL